MDDLRRLSRIQNIRELKFDVSDFITGIIFKERNIEKTLVYETYYNFCNGIINKKISNNCKTESKSVTEYNDVGYEIRTIDYDKYNCEKGSKSFKYNTQNQIIEIYSKYLFDYPSVSKFIKSEFFENDHGVEQKVIKDEFYYKDVFSGFSKSYFTRSNPLFKREEYNENRVLVYTKYFSYNSLDQLFKITTQYVGEAYTSLMYQRNSIGDIIEIVEEKNFTKMVKEQYEYIYDSFNNWIEQRKIENGKITGIIERTIHYF